MRLFILSLLLVNATTFLNAQSYDWAPKASFAGEGRQSAVGFSIGSKGYIGTGYTWNGNVNDFWEYDPSTNVWTQKANVGTTVRTGAAGFAIGNKGYIGSGNNNSFYEYDP